MENSEKVRENKTRRWAQRLGYGIVKSRAKRLRVDDLGRYSLVELRDYAMVLGPRYDATLEQIEAHLAAEEAQLAARRR